MIGAFSLWKLQSLCHFFHLLAWSFFLSLHPLGDPLSHSLPFHKVIPFSCIGLYGFPLLTFLPLFLPLLYCSLRRLVEKVSLPVACYSSSCCFLIPLWWVGTTVLMFSESYIVNHLGIIFTIPLDYNITPFQASKDYTPPTTQDSSSAQLLFPPKRAHEVSPKSCSSYQSIRLRETSALQAAACKAW